jgi:hypothetical protein
MEPHLFCPINLIPWLLVPLHVILMMATDAFILAVTWIHLPLAYMQSHTHVPSGRCESSECIFFRAAINRIIFSEMSVKQDEPLWEMDLDACVFF